MLDIHVESIGHITMLRRRFQLSSECSDSRKEKRVKTRGKYRRSNYDKAQKRQNRRFDAEQEQPRRDNETFVGSAAFGNPEEYYAQIDEGKALEDFVLGAEDDVVEFLTESAANLKPDRGEDVYGESLQRKPAWIDEDEVKAENARLQLNEPRFLELAKQGEEIITQQEHQKRLKNRFEVVYGETPAWADLEIIKQDDGFDEDERALLRRTGDYIDKKGERNVLTSSYLDWTPLARVNGLTPHKSTVSTVRFHKTSHVIMTASMDRGLVFYKDMGRKCEVLHSLFVKKFPIYCARFTTDHHSVVLASEYRSLYEYDITAGKMIKIQPVKALEGTLLSYFEPSPCGTYLAFRGDYGYINILSCKSKELLFQLKMNGDVNSICFSPDSKYLYSFGSDGEVYIWDMSARACIHKFIDEGCLDGTVVSVDANSQFLSCASRCGVVNLYDINSCFESRTPKPRKVFNNLLTSCTSLAFNPTSQIMALASNKEDLSIKLAHLPSMSIYHNFPSAADNMTQPTDIDFSPNSGLMAVGTSSGFVHMYRLQHFSGY